MDETTGFESLRIAAEKLTHQEERLKKTVEKSVEKAEKQKRKILDFWDELQWLLRMVRSYLNREYRNVPWKTIVFAVAAIIYFLNPFDAVPDIIPGLGYLDDATVVGFVFSAVKDELEKYKASRPNPPKP